MTAAREDFCGILSRREFLTQRDYAVEDCYSEHTSHYNQKLHFHDFYELSIVYEGRTGFFVNGIPICMEKGSLQLVTPADYHMQVTGPEEHIRYFNLIFTADLLSDALQKELEERSAPLFAIPDRKEWENLLSLTQRLCREYQTSPDDPLSRSFLKSGIELLCISLLRLLPDQAPAFSDTKQEPVRRALAYVRQNYRTHLTLADAAEAAGLSPAWFSTCFKQDMGISFSRYLTDYRLKMASRYLRSGDLPLKQIASLCGFSSYSYFLSAFAQRYGQPPGKYRRG